MPVELVDQSITGGDGDDYAVTLRLPEEDGAVITILIPRSWNEHYASHALKDGETYGLNLVTDSHYT
jgi:hypothetical protein